jgi:hypothetical protein
MVASSANRPKLWILASVVWLAWLIGVLVTWFDYRWHVLHPHFLPVVSLFVIQCASGLALLGAALWHIVRRPRRSGALGCLLLGITPLWLWSAHFTYGAWTLYGQHAALTAPVKMAGVSVASFADMAIRYRHRRRAEGKRVILFHDSANIPEPELASIDRHIEQMEELLGRPPAGRMHWIRGPVFAQQGELDGWYLHGLAIVTRPTTGVETIDRHEIAHAVIDAQCGPDAQPPLVLVEGWAESQAGYKPGFLAFRAWERKRRGEVLGLRDLTSDGWYASGDWPVYVFGGALVEFFLDAFGGQRFFELYSTCRRETFAEDCNRILGIDLDELDRRYWSYVETRVQQLLPQELNPLLTLPLADDVDQEAWRQFAREYADATDRLDALLQQSQVEFSVHRTRAESREQTSRYEVIHDGRRHWMISNEKGIDCVTCACPERSFLLTRQIGAQAWTPDGWDSQRRRSEDYWAAQRWIRLCRPRDGREVFENEFLHHRGSVDFRVTQFARTAVRDTATVRLQFEYRSSAESPLSTGWFILFPDRSWAMGEYEICRFWGTQQATYRGRMQYADEVETRPFPEVIQLEFDSPQGHFHETLIVERRNFKPADDDVFQPETFGVAASAIDRYYRPPWFVLAPAVAAPISLLLGIVLLIPGEWCSRQPK